jgi:predicted enzyme related to lactoylglutathione lyase
MDKNHINWFEIPVKDMARAAKFYTAVFDVTIETDDVAGPDFEMGVFRHGPSSVSGALVKGEGYEPSDQGALLYLNAEPDLDSCLNKVEAAGGKVAVPKFKVSDEIGYIAFFYDTEGNKLGMHASK